MFVKKTNTLWHCITISFQITAKAEQQISLEVYIGNYFF